MKLSQHSWHVIAAALTAALSLLMGQCRNSEEASESVSLTQFVDPTIGSGGHGHVFVGANAPYGMVQLGPTSIPQAWDWTSGYHDSDSTIIDFSHTHLSGTGIGDLFDITVMPVVGEVTYSRGNSDDPESGLWSYGKRSEQVTRAGYYSIPLERYGILAELTATPRVGFHRYTFPASDNAAIVFDLQNGGCWDAPTSVDITPEGYTRITGHRHSTGWAADQKVYFAAEFSEPFEEFTRHGRENRYARFQLTPSDTARTVMLKVAISPNSVEAARANLDAELPGWDFDATAEATDAAWNKELGRVKVTSNDEKELRKFYTSLYHAMTLPATFNDYGTKPEYTILSLWDTYRAQLPLLTVIDPERSGEIANTMLDIYDRQGRLPVWHLWGNETDCMVGNPGIIAVADAAAKRLPGVDAERALKAMIATANDTARGGALRQKYGYIPCNLMTEAVAYDMEYAVADGAIAAAARTLGDSVTAAEFDTRSHSWRNFFDESTLFVRGLDSKGNFRIPFDPYSTTHRVDDYCEGNAWQYTWLAPHDLKGIIEAYGSEEATLARLDTLFTAESKLTGDASPDITGMIGQYVHGNEPDHHVIYFYTMLGKQERAGELVNKVLSELYTDRPDGLCGNEDAGQMSAWFVLSSLGFYQVEPASGRYWFGAPYFERAEIAVPGGKFVVEAPGAPEKTTINSATLNGKKLDRMYVTHDEIMAGGTLVLEMK